MTFGQARQLAEQRYPGVSSDLRDQFINDRYRQIVDACAWRGLQVEAYLATVAEYITGTVAIANGATALTGTGTTFTSAMTGREIRLTGDDEFYKITYVSATALTLSRAYEGDTVTASAFRIFKRIFSLASDIEVLQSIKRLNDGHPMEQRSRQFLDEIAPSRNVVGSPTMFALHDYDSNGRPQVELYPIPNQAWGIPYVYTKRVGELSATSDGIEQWIPQQLLLEGVFADLAPIAGEDGSTHEARFQARLRQMIAMEARARPGRQLRMRSRHTAHRRARGV